MFAQHKEVVVDQIIISGNVKTKDYIILRELDFKKNDTISIAKPDEIIELNKNKIFNTELFLTVEMALIEKGNNHIQVFIAVKERWYIFPFPIVELADRNITEWGQESNYSLSRLDLGVKLEHANFRGRKENLQLILQTGYTKKYELFHIIPYVNKEKTLGLNYGISYTKNKIIPYQTDYFNKRIFLDSKDILRRQFRLEASTTYRKKFYAVHQIGTAFFNNNINEQLLDKNPNYLGNNKKIQQYFNLFYSYDLNKTNINYYPTKGYSFNTTITQNGLGIFKDVNLTELTSDVSVYKELKPRLTLASRISGKTSTGTKQPYLQQQGFGYLENFVRGYEPFVIDAQHFVLNRTELKFKLLSFTTNLSKIIKAKAFHKIPNTYYINIYNDVGYAKNNNSELDSELVNKWLQGYGIGIDYVSFYDIVIRFEYSFASIGTHGFNIHLDKSI